jgi:hypothetical protein
MEGAIRATENRALQERRVWTVVGNSIVDGVISIDRLGFIKRFK